MAKPNDLLEVTKCVDQEGHKVKVQLVRSLISISRPHRICIKGLGLRKLWSVNVVPATSSTWGALAKVHYLVRIVGQCS